MEHNIVEPAKTRRHSFEFSQDDIIEILKKHIGDKVPIGSMYLSGLAHDNPYSPTVLTLNIDEAIV